MVIDRSNLKVLHLSTFESYGGAAIATRRVHSSMISRGIDSTMLVRFAKNGGTGVVQMEASQGIAKRANRIMRRGYLSLEKKKLVRGNDRIARIAGGLTDPRADLLTDFDQLGFEPNIIHLHKVEGFVDLNRFVKSIPSHIGVVTTLHDLSAVTGGCDYPQSCHGFAKSCGKCPAIGSNKAADISRKFLELKQQAFADKKQVGFIANSEWTAREARKSSIVGSHPVSTIHFGIDTTAFHSCDREAAKKALGISEDREVLLFGATDPQNVRKGGEVLGQIIEAFDDTHILSFGAKPIRGTGDNYSHLGTIESETMQSLGFRAADVFVMPSLEEAFGLTAQEAISSGTVVAAFASGGIPEIVTDGLNGMLAPKDDFKALVTGIRQLLDNDELRHSWAKNATQWCDKNFNVDTMVDDHVRFYQSLSES